MRSHPTQSLAAAALIASLCVLSVAAQTKPDLSGTWKMNREKSKFTRGGPENLVIKIDRKEPALTEDWAMSTRDGDRSFQAKYATDGKETEQEVMGRTAKTSAKWEGDALVIEFKSEGGFFRRKITLSADGKTMTKLVTQTRGDGQQSEDTVVFDKQ